MSNWYLPLIALGISIGMASCNNSELVQVKSVAERKAAEKQERNPVKKGRYQCWRISSAGNEMADDLFILSDKIYQVAEDTGMYMFDQASNTLQFTSGPFHYTSETWVGVYTPKGGDAGNGGKTQDTKIEIRKQSDIDTGNKRVIVDCNYAEIE